MTALIHPRELAAHLQDPTWRIFDCRHDLADPDYGEKAYAKAHVPGALFLSLDKDLSGCKTGKNGRHPLPTPHNFAEKMSACGVGPETQVVAYDNEGGVFAARFWWTLRWLGHKNVALLNGGLAGWKREKQSLTADVPVFPSTNFTVTPGSFETVDTAQVQAHLNTPDILMLDARSEERFSGEQETIDPVGGHIPGAINRFYFDNLDDNGLYFKSAEELHEEFAALLAHRTASQVIQQCGSGVTACHNILAMELAGLPGSKLYVGSWSEWCADPSRPIATGA